MLYDRIQQLSDKIHSELRPSQDDEEMDSSSCRIGTADTSSLTSDDKSRNSAATGEDISSGNSTLVDEESLNTSVDEDSRDLNSHALVVYSEVNESPVSNTEEQEQLHEEELKHTGGTLDSDGDHRHSQKSNDKGGSGRGHKLPTEDIDPKLYKALEKMKKLDERLANLTKVVNAYFNFSHA